MNTIEISEYLNRDLICSKNVYGVYPAIDENRRGDFFDSMGRFPTKWFKTFLDKNCTAWIWNEKQLQSVISKFCGHYCIFYCLYRCRGLDVRKVAKMFTNDTSLNDSIVHNFVCNVYRFLFNKI